MGVRTVSYNTTHGFFCWTRTVQYSFLLCFLYLHCDDTVVCVSTVPLLDGIALTRHLLPSLSSVVVVVVVDDVGRAAVIPTKGYIRYGHHSSKVIGLLFFQLMLE